MATTPATGGLGTHFSELACTAEEKIVVHQHTCNITSDFLLDILSYLQDKEWGKCCLVMLDPDAPSPRSEELGGSACGSLGPWLHWLVVDAVGTPEHVRRLCALDLLSFCVSVFAGIRVSVSVSVSVAVRACVVRGVCGRDSCRTV